MMRTDILFGGRSKMVVGVLNLDLSLGPLRSIKMKRCVVKGVINRLRKKYNISIAEVGDFDIWGRAKIGMCLISNDKVHVNSRLDRIVNEVEDLRSIHIINHDMEILNL